MGLFSEPKVLGFIESVYQTSADPSTEGWANVFHEFASMVSSGPGGISVHSSVEDSFSVITTTVDPDSLNGYFDYYQHVSPFRRALAQLKPGEHFSRRAFLDDDTYLKSPYYNEFSKPQDVFELEYHALSEVNGMTGGLSLSRPKHRPEFSAEETKFIAIGVHHLRIAFSNHLTLARLRKENQIYNEILESSGCAVFVIDTSLKVIYTNSIGENELKRADLMRRTRAGKMSLRSDRAMRQLRSLADQTRNKKRLDSDVPKNLSIGKQDDGSDVWLNVAIGGSHLLDSVTDSETIVLYTSKPLTSVSSLISIASTHGLTPAEIKVVELLSQGDNVRSICDKLSISENTVRTHLKHAFSKTGTNRQADLVRLILA